MNQNLEMKFLQKGIVTPELQKAEVDKIIAAIPSDTRSQYPEDADEAAAAYADTFYALADNTPSNGTVANKNQKPATTEHAKISVPAAESKKLASLNAKTVTERKSRAANTKIKKLLADKPYPGDYIKKGATMIPTTTVDKMEKYKADLVPDAVEKGNEEAYNKLLAAVKGGTPLEISIADKEKWKPTLKGAVVNTPSGEAGKAASNDEVFTIPELTGFVTTQLYGYIACAQGQIGCELKGVTEATKKANANGPVFVPQLRIAGKQDAWKNSDMHEFISVATKEETGTLVKSELAFKVYTGDPDSKGVRKIRTVHVSGKASLPVFKRSSAIYEKKFAMAKRNDMVNIPTDDIMDKHEQLLSEAQYSISKTPSAFGTFGKTFAEDLSKQQGDAGAASQPDAINI